MSAADLGEPPTAVAARPGGAVHPSLVTTRIFQVLQTARALRLGCVLDYRIVLRPLKVLHLITLLI